MRHWTTGIIISIFAVSAFAHPAPDDLAWNDDALLASSVQFDPQVSIQIRGDYRYIDANGIPNHDTGDFPNRGNPNSISPQNYHFRVPVSPTANEKSMPNHFPNLIGIAINGVPFDPATANFWHNDHTSIWNEEAINTLVTPAHRGLGIDFANAHVQPRGAYHYHSVPWPLLQKIAGKDYTSKMTLIGYAADGFPIYGPYAYSDSNDPTSKVKLLRSSYRLKEGIRPANSPGGKYDGNYTGDWKYVANAGDLDENNGRSGVTPEYPNGTYYYVITDEFPFIPRSFKSTPDKSFERSPRAGAGQRQPPLRGPRN